MKNVITCVTCCKIQQFLTESRYCAWLLVGYSFMPLFMSYPIKEDTDSDKTGNALLERCCFFLYL